MIRKTKLLVLTAVTGLLLVGCNENSSTSTPSSPNGSTSSTPLSSTPGSSSLPSSSTSPVLDVKVEITGPDVLDTSATDASITLNATVTGSSNTAVTWSSNSTKVTVTGGVVKLAEGVKIELDTTVGITATSVADPNKFATKTITVKAPSNIGAVDKLTSDMIKAIGNSSITVTGKLVDNYRDLERNTTTSNTYNMKTQMSDGAWLGEYWIDGGDHQSDNYRKGATDGLVNEYGQTGHGLEKLYINKNNEVTAELQTNYLGYPSVWEEAHLWNHLGSLNINKFKYDSTVGAYEYQIDSTSETDLYLMTYLSYCLTPLLSDTLVEFYVTCDDTQITGITASTQVLYYGADTAADAYAMSWSTLDLKLEAAGTTVVPEPQKYVATEETAILASALEKMGSATNYSFKTVDNMTYSPSPDDGDYDISTTTTKSRIRKKVQNGNFSTGTVGTVGKITAEAALFESTIKYSQSLDDKVYRVEYTGYKQNADNTYDDFVYDSVAKTLMGTKKTKGSMFDILPKFDFAAEVFECTSQVTSKGKTVYTFALRDSAITSDIATEISCYHYANSASNSVERTLNIKVDSEGNIVSSSYPYDLVSGTYIGYCDTTYYDIGTTVQDTDLFDGYAERVYKQSWSEYENIVYYPTDSTLNFEHKTAAEILKLMYGDSSSNFPTPEDFRSVFGDNVNGPWHDKKMSNVLGSADNPVYIDCFSINTNSSNLDKNNRITDFEELMTKLLQVLQPKGYIRWDANTDITNANNRNVTFLNEDAGIVINVNNLGYKTIYINCYKAGEWILKK